jgi:transcriptional regulator with XRE-family HTH domain
MNAPGDSTIGARVRAARERLGWRREELAYRSGISWSAIAQVESGRRRDLRPGTLSALAEALGVTIDHLVRGGPASPPMLEHRALIYGTEDEFLNTAVPYMADGVERSESVLAVTTGAKSDLLRERLGPDAGHAEFAESADWYSSPAGALESYRAFATAELEAGRPWVRIVGEPVWAGRSEKETRLWIRYESLLNLYFAAWPVSIVCPYDERSLAPEICRDAHLTHPQTIEAGVVSDSGDYAGDGGLALE